MTRVYVHEHFAASTDGLPQSRQVEVSRSLSAKKKMTLNTSDEVVLTTYHSSKLCQKGESLHVRSPPQPLRGRRQRNSRRMGQAGRRRIGRPAAWNGTDTLTAVKEERTNLLPRPHQTQVLRSQVDRLQQLGQGTTRQNKQPQIPA